MITHNFNTLDLLTSPVWIVSPFEEQLIYANSAARLLMQDLTFSQLRTGPYSVSSQKELPKYLSDLYRSAGNAGFKSQSLGKLSAQKTRFLCALFSD